MFTNILKMITIIQFKTNKVQLIKSRIRRIIQKFQMKQIIITFSKLNTQIPLQNMFKIIKKKLLGQIKIFSIAQLIWKNRNSLLWIMKAENYYLRRKIINKQKKYHKQNLSSKDNQLSKYSKFLYRFCLLNIYIYYCIASTFKSLNMIFYKF